MSIDNELQAITLSAENVLQPPDGTAEIHRLPIHTGFLCHIDPCNFRTTSTDHMRQHYNQKHQWHITHQGCMPWHQAYVQTLFTQKQLVQYFIVTLVSQG
jgi:hypothetical protein